MSGRDDRGRSSDADGGEHSKSPSSQPATHPRRHSRWRIFVWVVLVVAVVLGVGRAILPWAVRKYVNRTLDRNLLYSGKIGAVEIHLWRGAYSIHDVRLNKTTGNVPVPFFAAKAIDFSVQWPALLHGRVVARVLMAQPQLNFVEGPTTEQSQTGGGGPWLQMLQDLFPFDINRAELQDGSVHFRTYQAQKPVDVYISQLNGSVDDLTNIRKTTNPLVATVQATGLVMTRRG